MRFYVSIPGQPVSVDAAYRTGKFTITGRDGLPRDIHRPRITDEAKRWREDVQLLVQTAKPTRWNAAGQIRISIALYLAGNIDDDNCLKLIYDGIAAALERNDRDFVHCVVHKESGLPLKDAHVELAIDSDPEHKHLLGWPAGY